VVAAAIDPCPSRDDCVPGFFYRPVDLYRCGAVRVYHNGINSIPLTARIQISNHTGALKKTLRLRRNENFGMMLAQISVK
jgi:hypothetical protein